MTAPNEIGYERVLVPVGDKSDPNMLTELSSTLVDPRRGAVRFTHVTTDRSFVGGQEEWRTGSDSVAESQHTLVADLVRCCHRRSPVRVSGALISLFWSVAF